MSQPFLIQGNPFGSLPGPQGPPSRSGTGWIKTLVAVWILVGAGFATFKLIQTSNAAVEPAARTSNPAITAISTDDLLRHMESINRGILDATQKVRRTEEQVTAVLPTIQRNYLLVEQRRLQNSIATAEAARRELEQCREEFELVLNSFRKEHEPQ